MIKNLLRKAWGAIKSAFKRNFDADKFATDLVDDIIGLRPDLYGSDALFTKCLEAVQDRLSDEEFHALYKALKVAIVMRGGVAPRVRDNVVASVRGGSKTKATTTNPDG